MQQPQQAVLGDERWRAGSGRQQHPPRHRGRALRRPGDRCPLTVTLPSRAARRLDAGHQQVGEAAHEHAIEPLPVIAAIGPGSERWWRSIGDGVRTGGGILDRSTIARLNLSAVAPPPARASSRIVEEIQQSGLPQPPTRGGGGEPPAHRRRPRRRFTRWVEPHGITLQQYNVLRISRRRWEAADARDFRAHDRAGAGITRLLDRLEAKGMVRRALRPRPAPGAGLDHRPWPQAADRPRQGPSRVPTARSSAARRPQVQSLLRLLDRSPAAAGPSSNGPQGAVADRQVALWQNCPVSARAAARKAAEMEYQRRFPRILGKHRPGGDRSTVRRSIASARTRAPVGLEAAAGSATPSH